MRSYSWRSVKIDLGEKIREILLTNGWTREENRSSNELWRLKLNSFTCIFYKSGTLYISYPDVEESVFKKIKEILNYHLGTRYTVPSRDFLIGFDEVGKGEIIGSIILAGVKFPKELFDDLDIIVDNVDTKHNHRVEYWEEVYRRLEELRDRGFSFLVEKVLPKEIDGKKSINKILDQRYKKLLESLIEDINLSNVRVVIDDYGVGTTLIRYLEELKRQGAEVLVVGKSEDRYLETRVASIIAKRERYIELKDIEVFSGYGNAGDRRTIDWLKNWYINYREWPWFVKKSFKTIKSIEECINNEGR